MPCFYNPHLLILILSFSGLLRGSAIGGPRKVVSQIYEHVAVPLKRTGGKRTSLPLSNMTFEPVMEREEDGGHDKRPDVDKSHDLRPVKLSGMKEDSSFDDKDEWDQVGYSLEYHLLRPWLGISLIKTMTCKHRMLNRLQMFWHAKKPTKHVYNLSVLKATQLKWKNEICVQGKDSFWNTNVQNSTYFKN